MSSVSQELSAGAAPAVRGRRDVAQVAHVLRPAALPLAVAAALAAVAFSGGGYALGVRNPVGIAVWWTAGLAVALGVWPRARVPRPALLSVGLLGALAALAAVSVAWADSAESAVEEAGRNAIYAGVLLLVVLAARRGSAARWADGCAAGIAVVGLAALSSRLLPGLGLDAAVSQFMDGEEYLSYPLDYWNGVAMLVALAFPLLLRIAVDGRAAWARSLAIGVLPALAGTLFLTASRGGMLTAAVATVVFVVLCAQRLRAACAAALALAGGVMVIALLGAREALVDGPFGTAAAMSQGRSATLLIALVGIAVAVAWHPLAKVRITLPQPSRTLRRATVALAGLLVAGAVVAADPVARFDSFSAPPPNPLADGSAPGEDLGTGSHLLSGTSSGRWQFWQAAGDAFADAPLLGHGAGSYEAWWAQHGSIAYFARHAHSLYLETAAELGLGGLLILVALAGVVALSAARRLRRAAARERTTIAALIAVAAAFAVAAGLDWMWELPAVTIAGLIAIGLLTGRSTLPAQDADAPGDGEREAAARPPRALRIVVPVCAAVAIGLLALPWLAQRDVRDSRTAALAGDTATAVDKARAAQRLTPWAASPHLQRALALEGAGNLEAARHAVARAETRAASDWRIPLVAARIERAAGDAAAATAALARARALNPRSPLFATRKTP